MIAVSALWPRTVTTIVLIRAIDDFIRGDYIRWTFDTSVSSYNSDNSYGRNVYLRRTIVETVHDYHTQEDYDDGIYGIYTRS